MPNRSFIILGGAVSLVIVAVLVWNSNSSTQSSDDESSSTIGSGINSDIGNVVRASGAGSSRNPVQNHSVGDPIETERFETYLRENSEDPLAWTAVYDLSRDVSVLEKALETFPEDFDILARAAFYEALEEKRPEIIKSLRNMRNPHEPQTPGPGRRYGIVSFPWAIGMPFKPTSGVRIVDMEKVHPHYRIRKQRSP